MLSFTTVGELCHYRYVVGEMVKAVFFCEPSRDHNSFGSDLNTKRVIKFSLQLLLFWMKVR